MPRTVKLLPLLLLASLVAIAPASAENDVPEYRSSDNLGLVAHIPGAGGTDIEFFTRELRVWKDAEGTVHEIPEEEPPVTRHFAMVGNRLAPSGNNAGPMSGGAKIIDITDPESPFIAGAVRDCWADQGDIQIRADGMLAGIAKQGGTCRFDDGTSVVHGAILVDISDPYDPTILSVAPDPRGAHNITFHPSGDYVYISSSGDTPNHVPIYDITDPTTPVRVRNYAFPDGNSPHDIRFSEDGTRAYAAGINRFRIINTEDPANPSLIVTFQVPGSTIGHDTLITPDKRFLFAGEELNGGGTAPCPGGAVYVYDLLNEAEPELLGAVWAESGPVTGRNATEAFAGGVGGCTSHVIDLNPDKRSFTIGWYVSGSRTFDFSGLYDASGNPSPAPALSWGSLGAGPVKEDGWIVPNGGNTWSAKQYAGVPGYIFSDDLVMGFYVTKITP